MVPNGWEVKSPSELFKLFSGFAFKSSDAQESGAKWLKIANVGIGEIKWDADSFLPENFLIEHKKYLLTKGDIVVALTRPTLGNKLKVARLNRDSDISLLNQRVAKIVCKESADSEFTFQVLRSDQFAFRINVGLLGTDPPNLSVKVLEDFTIPVPPLPEQRKIAKILSTWDKAISTTERLIDNSKQQKKALMQQLLTGKKRLLDDSGKPFEGEWKKVELGKLLDYKQPTPYLVKSTEYSDEYNTPVLTAGKTFVLGYSNEDFGIFSENLPVIIFDDFTTASKFVDFPFKAKSSAMKILIAIEGVSIKYIYEAMQVLNYPVGGHQRHWISIFSNLVIGLPTLEEQQKIAAVLSNADKEVELLEKQLSDLKQEKKALMQQLLTGKRRVKV